MDGIYLIMLIVVIYLREIVKAFVATTGHYLLISNWFVWIYSINTLSLLGIYSQMIV